MSSEAQTMQIRKFLKRVGVESHAALDAAIEAADGPVTARMTLVIEGAETVELVFDAEIDAA